MACREVRVPHRRSDGTVAEQFLNATKIHASLHPLGCREMAQVMDGYPIELRLHTTFIEGTFRLPPSIPRLEPRKNVGASDYANQRLQPRYREIRKRNVSWLPAFRVLNG